MSSDDDSYGSPSEEEMSDYESPKKRAKKTTVATKTTVKKPAASTRKKAAATSSTTISKPKKPTTKKAPSKSKLDDDDDDDEDMIDLDDDEDEDDKPKRKTTTSKKSSNGENVFENVAKSGKTIEEIYQKKELLDQILLRPDTYIGSIESQKEELYVLEEGKMVKKSIDFVPGIYKIFDEILVNAADNRQRDAPMKFIKVEIDREKGRISVSNDGAGIPVVIHKEHKIYVPELIFGNLLTSSHYDDTERRLTGGRNGFGAKLANIFSTKFIVECADSKNRKLYKQTFTNNMKSKEEPVITTYSKTSDYTTITFYPELKRFGMTHFDDDLMSLLTKRVYDVAGCNVGLKVQLNGEDISFKSFEKYIALYIDNDDEDNPIKVYYERVSERWELAIALSTEQQFQQVSFVNSICTTKGGTHVQHAIAPVVTALIEKCKKTNKTVDLKPALIKNHLFVFVNALIENPQFDSQTKETLTTKISNFGSRCEVTESYLKKILNAKSGIVEAINTWAKFKEQNSLSRKLSSGKKGRPFHPKLDDANLAGSKKSEDCTLILTEGDSAKTLATAGISVVGRDLYGAFPLKGKIENVDELSKALKNDEINSIVSIMGFQHQKEYTDVSSLRYGHLMIMTDQDHDGSHIKGLLINLIRHFWPSLLKIPGFLVEFITPIVKCFKKGQKTISFYTLPEFLEWKKDVKLSKGWEVKYYKGLGTSKPEEGKEYFAAIDKHKIDFEWDDEADANIDLAFNKKRADDRKKWMQNFVEGTYLDQYGTQKLCYSDFINKELILFSIADCDRSIPNFIDGFKTSTRKIMYSCFKRNLKNEIRVAQLIGYVSEKSAYHHGEASLNQAIVGMAQDYVGANNINLLYPSGSFGSRYMGGQDCSSARYIHTKMNDIARAIFHPDDDPILTSMIDDGKKVQPKFYVPIIPMVLVNGIIGIGTGWSTKIPSYNPRELIENTRLFLDGKEMKHFIPWSRGFIGEVTASGKAEQRQFTYTGKWNKLGEHQFEIVELPVGYWTQDCREDLEELLNPGTKAKRKAEKSRTKKKTSAASAPKKRTRKSKDDDDEDGNSGKQPVISNYLNYSSESKVHFIIDTINPVDDINIEKVFRLTTTTTETNMVVFDEDLKIVKIETPMEMMKKFLEVRMRYYDMRKNFLVDKLNEEHKRLSNKARFILGVINNEIIINKVKKVDIMKRLKEMKFDKLYNKKAEKEVQSKIRAKQGKFEERDAAESDNEDEMNEDGEEIEKDDDARGYDYLLSLPIWSLTLERVKKIQEEEGKKKMELKILSDTAIKTIYRNDLDALEKELDKMDEYFRLLQEKSDDLAMKSKGKKLPKSKRITAAQAARSKPPVLKKPSKPSAKTSTTTSTASKRKKDDSDVELIETTPIEKPTKPTASTAKTLLTTTSPKISDYFKKVNGEQSASSSKSTTPVTISDEDEDEEIEKRTVKKTKTSVAQPEKPKAKTTKKAAASTGKRSLKKMESSDESESNASDNEILAKNIPVRPSLRSRGSKPINLYIPSSDSEDEGENNDSGSEASDDDSNGSLFD